LKLVKDQADSLVCPEIADIFLNGTWHTDYFTVPTLHVISNLEGFNRGEFTSEMAAFTENFYATVQIYTPQVDFTEFEEKPLSVVRHKLMEFSINPLWKVSSTVSLQKNEIYTLDDLFQLFREKIWPDPFLSISEIRKDTVNPKKVQCQSGAALK
jgi:hypothetical protein